MDSSAVDAAPALIAMFIDLLENPAVRVRAVSDVPGLHSKIIPVDTARGRPAVCIENKGIQVGSPHTAVLCFLISNCTGPSGTALIIFQAS